MTKTNNNKRPLIAIAFALFLLIGVISGTWGVILPSLLANYNLDKGAGGYLFLAVAVGYLLAAVASSYLVEKLGTRVFLVIGILLFIFSCLIVALNPPFAIMLFVRILLGFAAAMLETGANFVIAVLPNSTALLNYLHAFFGGGALVGPALTSQLLAIGVTWNNIFWIWIVAGAILAVAVWYYFRAEKAVKKADTPENSNLLRQTLTSKLVWIAAWFLLLYVGVEMVLGLWTYTYLTEAQRIDNLVAGWMVSGYWFGLTLGRIIPPTLVKRWQLTERQLIELCLIGTTFGLILLWLIPNGVMMAISLGIIGFCLGPIYPTTLAVMAKLVPSRLLPSTIGFVASLSILGVAIFPWLAGLIAQDMGLSWILPYTLLVAIGMIGLWLMLARYVGARKKTSPEVPELISLKK
jgi:fucose permease